MAWRYIQRDLQAGDILDPEDWNENVREYLEEINGAIDRDNIPASAVVVGSEVDSAVFNEISVAYLIGSTASTNSGSYGSYGPVQLLDTNTQAFQKIDMTSNLSASSDELLLCEASIQFDTADAYNIYGGGNYEDGYVIASKKTLRDWLYVDFRMTIDGFEVAYAGPTTVHHRRQCIYMTGALPVEAGAHVVEVWVRLYHNEKAGDGGSDKVTWYNSTQDLSPRIAAGTILINRRKR